MADQKEFVIFAGVNGAGKTSIYEELFQKYSFQFSPRINPDEMIHNFRGNWKNPEDQLKSGKICLQKQKEYFSLGASFHRETTFSSQEILRSLEKALFLDYKVTIYFVHVAIAQIALERVAKRVQLGGHGISEKDIARRFERSVENIVLVAQKHPVQIFFYDNSNDFPQIVGSFFENQWDCYESTPWLEDIIKKVDQK